MESNVAVLVVESNVKDLDIICDSLKRIGVTRLLCMENAEDAIEYLRHDHDIDILITGQVLPEQSGTYLISVVKDIYRHIQSILCEDTNDVMSGLRARSNGACEFVRKDTFESNLDIIIPPVVNRVSFYHKVIANG